MDGRNESSDSPKARCSSLGFPNFIQDHLTFFWKDSVDFISLNFGRCECKNVCQFLNNFKPRGLFNIFKVFVSQVLSTLLNALGQVLLHFAALHQDGIIQGVVHVDHIY